MNSIKNISVTEEDIQWATGLLGNDIYFDSEQKNVLRDLSSIDVQAFPGSGKTTVLVAKLAILARKWKSDYQGICVLSHTNVAKNEIRKRLTKSGMATILLQYPHYIGTIQKFFDTYIAIPWLKSQGYPINLVDTQRVCSKRWEALEPSTRNYLDRQRKTKENLQYYPGSEFFYHTGRIQQEALEVIKVTQKEGFFTYEEMFGWTKNALSENPNFRKSISHRFPFLLIDEFQDTNEMQWILISTAFDDQKVIIQRFGDENQEIYENGSTKKSEMTINKGFPRKDALLITTSKRFDDRIACLVNPFAVTKKKIIGTDNIFTSRHLQHTIFAFKDKDGARRCIEEYCKLILHSFTDEELKNEADHGKTCHVVGMIHNKPSEEKKFPSSIMDYWDDYCAPKENRIAKFNMFYEYILEGAKAFQRTFKKIDQVKWICKGIYQLLVSYQEPLTNSIVDGSINGLTKTLDDKKKIEFRKIIQIISDIPVTEINDQWDLVVNYVDNIMKLYSLKLQSINNDKFLSRPNDDTHEDDTTSVIYHYRDHDTGRELDVTFGTIHSVKGETHLATMVVETFCYKHLMDSILKNNFEVEGKPRIRRFMHVTYVAASRPCALLCMAIPISELGGNRREKLEGYGWKIKEV